MKRSLLTVVALACILLAHADAPSQSRAASQVERTRGVKGFVILK